jgi:hypothetical protein
MLPGRFVRTFMNVSHCTLAKFSFFVGCIGCITRVVFAASFKIESTRFVDGTYHFSNYRYLVIVLGGLGRDEEKAIAGICDYIRSSKCSIHSRGSLVNGTRGAKSTCKSCLFYRGVYSNRVRKMQSSCHVMVCGLRLEDYQLQVTHIFGAAFLTIRAQIRLAQNLRQFIHRTNGRLSDRSSLSCVN